MRKFLALGLLFAASCAAADRTPIILDTDIGDDIDDALALALALQSPELDVRAVTTVIDDTESRTRLAWKELGLYGRHDVALATGASQPLLDPVRVDKAPQFELLTPADTAPPAARRRAADLIVDTLMASPDKITLVPIGPLTNIALALKAEPRIKDHIQRIVLMGGAYDRPSAEYNIRRDPVAAAIVFRSGVPITSVGLDVTMKCQLNAADMARLRAAQNPATRFLVKLIDLWKSGHPHQEFPILHDPLAVAVTMFSNLVETQLGSVDVELTSQALRGMTVFTPADRVHGAAPSTLIARQVDARKFLNLFLDRVTAAPR